jgi:conjugal transfer mating pair stabilization protein TraG
MTLPIYVISNGNAAWEILNSIAIFCNSKSLHILTGIGALIGFLSGVTIYANKKDPRIFMNYFGLYLLTATFLVAMRFDVEVIDITDPMSTYRVSNVPAGLAIPASLISEVMHGITQGVDDVFHSPNDLNYTSTGLLYGSKLFEASLQPPPISKDLQQNVDDFYRQCILPDILINKKYSFDDLHQEANLIEFLDAHASLLRGIYIKGSFYTCKGAISVLKGSLFSSKDLALAKMQNQLVTSIDRKIPSGQFANDLQGAYSYYLGGLSMDAGTILMQNLLVGGLRQAALNNAATYNSSAAQLINYSQVAGSQSMVLELLAIPKIIADWLPLIQTVGFMIGMCMFVIIVLFTMLPGGVGLSYIKGYVGFLVSICSWPFIYDLVNYISNLILSARLPHRTGAAAGITLSNVDQLQYFNSVTYGIAGLLAISFTIGGILGINKLGNTMQSAAQNLLGFARNSAGSIATSTSQGNISTGNMNSFNASANKTDLNESFTYGMQSMTNDATGMTDKFYQHDGKSEYIGSDASGFMVGGNYNINFAQETSAQLQHMASETKAAASNTMVQASDNLSSNFEKLDQFSHQLNNDKQLQSMFSSEQSLQMMESYQSIKSNVERYGQEHGWTQQQMNDVSHSLSLSGGVSASGSLDFSKNLGSAEANASVGVSGNASLSRDVKDSTVNQLEANYTSSLSQEDNKSLETQQQNIQHYMHQVQALESQGVQLSKSDQVISNISKDVGLMHQASAEFSQASQYESMANSISSTSASYNQNMMPQFEKMLVANAVNDPVAFDAHRALIDKERGMPVSDLDNQALTLMQERFVASTLPKISEVSNQVAGNEQFVMHQGKVSQSLVNTQGHAAMAINLHGSRSAVGNSFSKAGGAALDEKGLHANQANVQGQIDTSNNNINTGKTILENERADSKATMDKNTDAIKNNEDRGVFSSWVNMNKKEVD